MATPDTTNDVRYAHCRHCPDGAWRPREGHSVPCPLASVPDEETCGGDQPWKPSLNALNAVPVGGMELLTDDEHRAIQMAGELFNLLARIVGDGDTRDADMREACHSVHLIQHTVMAQAAARAYPERYRLLGGNS